MPFRRHVIALVTLLALIGTLGCDWVDATGRQPGAVPPEDAPVPSGVPVPTVADVPIPTMDAVPLALTERTPRDVRLDGADGTLDRWRWRALDEPADLDACSGVPGFDPALAERTLAAACTDRDDCALLVAERRDALGTHFTLELPTLRAPVAARVALVTTDAGGRDVERRRTLCGLSINEAPEAGDDRFEVRVGTVLTVTDGGPGNLLANDRDDDDVRNAPLSIDPEPARRPRHAALFELGDGGGFVYRPRDDVLDTAGDTLEDSFAYRLTDGVHGLGGEDIVGEVTIVITAGDAPPPNRPPRAIEPLPDLEIALDPLLGAETRLDLSTYFDDPDGDRLLFSVLPGSLPPGGGLAVDADGVLAGRLGLADLGRRRVTLVVDDGRARIERDFVLDVVRAFEANAAPSVTDIANRVVSGRFAYDVAPFFDDPDGDPLRFSARGLPKGVEIADDGTISGRSKKKNRGRWFVVVTAEDERGGEVSDGFRLTIE